MWDTTGVRVYCICVLQFEQRIEKGFCEYIRKDRVIDEAGFRPNVGIIVTNQSGQVLWGKRVKGRDSWQFPQGGINADESPEEAMFRELQEEIGLLPEHVTVLGVTNGWLRYRLPSKYIRKHETPICIGQKQKWFCFDSTRLMMRSVSIAMRSRSLRTGSG